LPTSLTPLALKDVHETDEYRDRDRCHDDRDPKVVSVAAQHNAPTAEELVASLVVERPVPNSMSV
jgi:hypothetical protein